MRIHPRLKLAASVVFAASMLIPAFAFATEPAASSGATTTPSRYQLTSSTTEASAQQSSRYTLRARFAPAESAGELREGANFTLIGRFAKGNVNCGTGGTIFTNGFEGN